MVGKERRSRFTKAEVNKFQIFVKFGIVSDVFEFDQGVKFRSECHSFFSTFPKPALQLVLKNKLISNLDEFKFLMKKINSMGGIVDEKAFKLLCDKKLLLNFDNLREFLEDYHAKKLLHHHVEIVAKYLIANDYIKDIQTLIKVVGLFHSGPVSFERLSPGESLAALQILLKSNLLVLDKDNLLQSLKEYTNFDTETIQDNFYQSRRGLLAKSLSFEQSIDLYSNLHPLLILFGATEDFSGDLAETDKVVREILQKKGLENSTKYPEMFETVLNSLVTGVESRIEKYRPVFSPATRISNIRKVNDLQAERLENSFNPEAYLSSVVRRSKDRTLVLYIRQAHGHMNSFKFCLMAKFLYSYIQKGRSPIFNQLKIVSRKPGEYPKILHTLGIPNETYDNSRVKSFESNGLAGNFFFFSHANAKDQQRMFSTPIIGMGTLRNQEKYFQNPKGMNTYIPYRAFHDKLDKAVDLPKDDSDFWKEYKDRGRNLERMMLACAASVFALENKMLNEIEK